MVTKESLLKHYSKLPVEFEELYKYKVSYVNREMGLRVTGTIDYRDSLYAKDTVQGISQLEDFNFEFIL